MGSVHSGLGLVFQLLAVVGFGMEAFALFDVARRPADAFPAAGKQTKKMWLIVLGFACLFGFSGAVGYIFQLSIFVIAAFVAAVIYLADVRPAVKQFGGGGGRRMGPYGPW